MNYSRIACACTAGIVLLLLLLLAPRAARAQDAADTTHASDATATRPFAFSGSAQLYGQIANRRGTFQQTPDDFLRLDVSPTLSVYNVPFTFHGFFSTEQRTYRQNMNGVSFDLDYHKLEGILLERVYNRLSEYDEVRGAAEAAGSIEHLRDSLEGIGAEKLEEINRLKEYADLDKLKDRAISTGLDKLDELGLVSGAEKFFANFPALGVGVTYPNYSTLTLSGVPVNGFNIEWNPGQFYVAAAYGKTQRAISVPGAIGNVSGVIDSVLIDPSYTRTLYAARIGVGRKEGGHAFLTGMYSKDDQSSLPVDTVLAPLTPKSNYVIGLDVNVPLVEDYLNVEGEVAGSMLTGDISAADLKSNDIPEFIRTTFDPNISSLIDFAFAAKSTLRIAETDSRLTASIRKVGPVYFSLGAPVLRNDNLRWEGRIEQRLLRGQISATAYYKQDEDNLSPGLKSTLATVTSFGVGLGLNFKGLPYLRAEYAPYQQRYTNVGDAAEVLNKTTMLNLSSGYYYKVAGLDASTTAGYTSLQSNTFQGLSDYGVSTLTLGQTVRFTVPLSLGAIVTQSRLTTAGDTSQTIVSLDLNAAYTAFGIWTNAAGFTVADQSGTDSNLGFFLSSSIPVWDAGFFEVRAEKNVYKNLLVNTANFDEFLMTATFSVNW